MTVAIDPLRRWLGNAIGSGRVGEYPSIGDLAIIGDRRTAAVVTIHGNIVWFCPGRLDAPPLLDALLDARDGGGWWIDLPGATPAGRRYRESSGVLETTLAYQGSDWQIADWMPMAASGVPHGAICRQLGPAPADVRLVLNPRPGHGRGNAMPRLITSTRAVIDARFELQASHPLGIEGAAIVMRVPAGDASWAVLSDGTLPNAIADADTLRAWRMATLASWRSLAARTDYDGAFAPQVHASLRTLRLLTFAETGAIAAAATTSLPEQIGGRRNYDYRFSWLRDSGITVRALLRFEPDGEQARRYLDFVATVLGTGYRSPVDVASAVGGERVPPQSRLSVAGYRRSLPALSGNKAARQLQLGSLANVLLVAREMIAVRGGCEHWDAVTEVADFVALHWGRRGHGIWEEAKRRHFTVSLVLAACGLEAMATHASSPVRATRYRDAAVDIRNFVRRACMTASGAFAAIAGGQRVDISAALFPVWDYVAASDPRMRTTIATLDRQYGLRYGLYRRSMLEPKVERREGAFLAGTFWVAHYWIAAGELRRGAALIAAGLRHATDLGLFAEEVDPRTGALLGNIPMALVHGSFLAAVADYHARASGQALP